MKPKISKEWDSVLAYEELIARALYAIAYVEKLAVDLVFSEKESRVQGIRLSHDRYGVTYSADFSTRKIHLDSLVRDGKANLTRKIDEAVLTMAMRECPELYALPQG